MSWVGNTIVTASVLPNPNNERLVVFPVGGGQGGAVQVELVGTSGSGAGSVVSIASPLQGGAVLITGSVWVLNPSSGSGGGGLVEISGILPWYQGGTGSLPVTLLNPSQPFGVTGTVGLSGPVAVTGVLSATIVGAVTVSVDNWPVPVTGVNVLNLPTTQSVYVVNQTSGTVSISGAVQISGTVAVSQTNIPLTQSVYVVNQTSGSADVNITQSIPLFVTSTQAAPVWVTGALTVNTGTINISGSFGVLQPSTGTAGLFAFQTSSADNILNSNANRIGFKVFNDSDGTYLLCFGPSASLNNWDVSVWPQWYYEDPYPGYTGPVTGIGFGVASGTIRVKEMKP